MASSLSSLEILPKIGKLNNTAQESTERVIMQCLKTVIEMLKDRGYRNIQACQTIDEVVNTMAESRHIVYAAQGDCVMHVFFHTEERVGVKQLRAWVEASSADKIIIISLDGPTAFTRKEAEAQYKQVQFLQFKDMCVNITRHILVPKHERVKAEDVGLEISSSRSELPCLYTTDRVAQYYAYEPGDIVRITRTAGVQEPVFYYRAVRVPPAA